MTKPALSQRIKAGIQGIALGVAKFAGYNAAMPNKAQAPATRTGTNPNSSYAQQQRVRLSFEGENAIKNTSFARNYINKRRMYCSSGITYAPDTGDHALDEAVSAYCMEQWKHMGVGCSMQQAFARASDVNLPERGDSALQWYRDEGRLRLLEVTADRIGELYQFTRPVRDVRSGEVYFSGLYLQGPNTAAYRIYERGFDAIYTNPQRVEACDIIFFKDDITGGVRGVSIFASALEDVNSRYQILKSTKDTMQQQSKIAAIASNNSGQPNELDYETQVSSQGAVEYVETMADGAIVKYQFNGDNYQVLKGEHPSDSFINGMRYLDASASLAVGFPYEFLFSGAQSGGAPFRGAFEAAGREIMRLRNDVHRPRLDVISYVTIMDGVERKKLPPMPNIARGCWGFTTLPTADAFRDDASDIKAIRSGITTKSAVIMANSGRSFPVVLRESMQEAVATAMAVEDANRALVKAGYKPSVTIADIAQVSDNPQQAAAAEGMTLSQETSVPLPDNSQKARLSEMISEECEGCEYCDDSIARMEDDSEKRFEKVVKDPETGRERTVRYGQAGKAADGGDRIRPGTAKGDSYCARSEKIKGDWRSDPNSPNNLSRKKWNCRGPKSLAKLAFDESKHPRADDGKFGSGGGNKAANPAEEFKKKHGRDPTFQELHGGKGGLIEKLEKKDGGNKAAIRDVTPEGFGPTESNYNAGADPERLHVDPVEFNKLKSSINEAQTLLKGDLSPEKQAQIHRSLEATKKKLEDLQNHEPTSPSQPAAKTGDAAPKKEGAPAPKQSKLEQLKAKHEALKAKNASNAKNLADANARVKELHGQLVEQLKVGTGTANDDLKKTVNELGAKIAETETHTATIQHALKNEEIAADESGQDSPEHEAARKRTEYVSK
jgi:hypothetical protein